MLLDYISSRLGHCTDYLSDCIRNHLWFARGKPESDVCDARGSPHLADHRPTMRIIRGFAAVNYASDWGNSFKRRRATERARVTDEVAAGDPVALVHTFWGPVRRHREAVAPRRLDLHPIVATGLISLNDMFNIVQHCMLLLGGGGGGGTPGGRD